MRSFLCIELADGVKSQLGKVAASLKQSPANVRWVRLDLLHLTLKFLGDIDVGLVPRLQQIAIEAADLGPFEFVLDTLGAFPNSSRPKVLWVGCNHAPPALIMLHQRLHEGLAPLGFLPERTFTPHVTLGRVRDSRPKALKELEAKVNTTVDPLTVTASHITLMQSVLRGQGGPDYSPMFTIKL